MSHKYKIGDIVRRPGRTVGITVTTDGKSIYHYEYTHHLLMKKVLSGFLTIKIETGEEFHIFDMNNVELVA